MEALNNTSILERLCESTEKWGLYISIFVPEDMSFGEEFEEVTKACSFLNVKEHAHIISAGVGWFLFDTQEECEDHFQQCVGDRPTQANPYKGSVKIYALACGPGGEFQNENT